MAQVAENVTTTFILSDQGRERYLLVVNIVNIKNVIIEIKKSDYENLIETLPFIREKK